MLDDARTVLRLALLQFFPKRGKAACCHRNLFHLFSRLSVARPTETERAAILIRQYVRGLNTPPPERYVGLAPEQNNHNARTVPPAIVASLPIT
jgi:hypothetical protein